MDGEEGVNSMGGEKWVKLMKEGEGGLRRAEMIEETRVNQ